jgi:hypothetical protein
MAGWHIHVSSVRSIDLPSLACRRPAFRREKTGAGRGAERIARLKRPSLKRLFKTIHITIQPRK